MVLQQITNLAENTAPLTLMELPDPEPQGGEVVIKVSACGVCHTELDEIEGRTPPPHLPIVLGHQVVGHVAACGHGAKRWKIGERLGVAWIFSACGQCAQCRAGNENLCSHFKATGRDAHGGYAQYMTVPEDFTYRIPEAFSDLEAAPLLCAGAIGYRSLKLTHLQDGQNLGLTGFGASAHLVLKMARQRYPNSQVFVFARSEGERSFARELGAVWTGDTLDPAPAKLAAIIDTTPAWTPVVAALKNLDAGGRLVINAIRKEDVDRDALARIDYPTQLWLEKEIKTVANVTRSDVSEFLTLAAEIPIQPEIQVYALQDANRALVELRSRQVRGAKVLVIES
jgi:propanol-preferring alcohol dehydrogenase